VRRVLLTGATGFVGPHVARRLLQAGIEVRALVRRDASRAPEGTAAVVGDLLDRASLDGAMQGGVDAVVHLATEPPGPPPRTGANVEGTGYLLDAARRTGVGRVVVASTMSVFDFLDPAQTEPLTEDHPPNPQDDYGREKLAAERLCAAAAGELSLCILRLTGVYGPGKAKGAVHNFLAAALRGDEIVIDADRAVDLLWVEDAAAALVAPLATADPPELAHVGAGQAVRLSDVAAAAWQAARPGQEPRVRAGAPGNRFCLDISRARRQLGYAPTPLAEALRRFLPAVRGVIEQQAIDKGEAS
jgi:nucleoside-diphosphate-sugar epimerase